VFWFVRRGLVMGSVIFLIIPFKGIHSLGLRIIRPTIQNPAR